MRPSSSPDSGLDDRSEHLSGLVILPAFATAAYYCLPPDTQSLIGVQFAPQLLAYGAFALWILRNERVLARLGLKPMDRGAGMAWGLAVGLVLGVMNSGIILLLVPWAGGDIEFLKDTPHAKVPVALMLPWLIFLIALFVEVNFRGFQLGRWLMLFQHAKLSSLRLISTALAVLATSLTFAFDPFMVATFRHLHWIALWDAVIWAVLWLRLGNLYATIVAHAVEVIIMYCMIRFAFT